MPRKKSSSSSSPSSSSSSASSTEDGSDANYSEGQENHNIRQRQPLRAAAPRIRAVLYSKWMYLLMDDRKSIFETLQRCTTNDAYIALLTILLESAGAVTLPDEADALCATPTEIVDYLEGPVSAVCPILCSVQPAKLKFVPLRTSLLSEVLPYGLDPPPFTADIQALQLRPAPDRLNLFVRLLRQLFITVGQQLVEILATRAQALLEVAVLLSNSTQCNFRLAGTLVSLSIGDGLLRAQHELKEDQQRYQQQLDLENNASRRSGAVAALEAQLRDCQDKTRQIDTLTESLRLSVANLRWKDKDPLLRWCAVDYLCRWALAQPEIVFGDSRKCKSLGLALYDRSASVRRLVALCLATIAVDNETMKFVNYGEGDFVCCFMNRLIELPDDTDEVTAAFGVLFLGALGERLKETETDRVVDTLWTCKSLLESPVQRSVLLKALAIFVDRTTFSTSVFEGGLQESGPRAALHMRTMVEFLTEFGPRLWPLYDRFVSAFWGQCLFLTNVALLLDFIAVGEADATENPASLLGDQYMLPVAALAVVLYQHLDKNASTEETEAFGISAESALHSLRRSTVAILSQTFHLLSVAKPNERATTCFAALIARAALHATDREVAPQLDKNYLVRVLTEAFKTCPYLGALDNLAASISLLGGAPALQALGSEAAMKVVNETAQPQTAVLRRVIAVLRTTDKAILETPQLFEQLLALLSLQITATDDSQLLALLVVATHLAFCHVALETPTATNKRQRHTKQSTTTLGGYYATWRRLLVKAARKHEGCSDLCYVILSSWLGTKRFLWFQFDEEDRELHGFASLQSTDGEVNAVNAIARHVVEVIEASTETGSDDPLLQLPIAEPESVAQAAIGLTAFGRVGFIEDLLDGRPIEMPKRRAKQQQSGSMQSALAWRIAHSLVIELELQTWDLPLLESPLTPLLISLISFKSPSYERAAESFIRAMCVQNGDLVLAVAGKALFAMLAVPSRRASARELARVIAAGIPAGYLLSNAEALQQFIQDGLSSQLGDAGRTALKDCFAQFVLRLPKDCPEHQMIENSLRENQKLSQENRRMIDALFTRRRRQL